MPQEQPFVIPVVEEFAKVEKQSVVTGKISIEKKVEEVTEDISVEVQHDEYTIKRVAINKYVDDAPPQVRHEGTTLIIPVVKEVVVKRLLLVEEVHIVKDVVSATEQVNIPLRKETVVINRKSGDDQQTL